MAGVARERDLEHVGLPGSTRLCLMRLGSVARGAGRRFFVGQLVGQSRCIIVLGSLGSLLCYLGLGHERLALLDAWTAGLMRTAASVGSRDVWTRILHDLAVGAFTALISGEDDVWLGHVEKRRVPPRQPRPTHH